MPILHLRYSTAFYSLVVLKMHSTFQLTVKIELFTIANGLQALKQNGISMLFRVNWGNAFRLLSTLICIGFFLLYGQTHAAWYQAQGQALIVNGNKQAAKQQATEEAIRQALLFSGASISSSQVLSNGLLKKDALQVTANGEVRRVEKVSERWHNDFITVTIRADIFPQLGGCNAKSSPKSVVSAPFTMVDQKHLLDGNIQALPHTLTSQFKKFMQQNTPLLSLDVITPFAIDWRNGRGREQAKVLGQQHNSQLVMLGNIEDATVIRKNSSWLSFQSKAERNLHYRIQLIDSINSAVLLDKIYQLTADWPFAFHSNIDTNSHVFWRSTFGNALEQAINETIQDISEAVACQPTTGRVLNVANNQVTVGLGKMHGLAVGDPLSLYQTSIFNDTQNRQFTQYNIHPEQLVVVELNYDNAVLETKSGALMGNIQIDDFVIQK